MGLLKTKTNSEKKSSTDTDSEIVKVIRTLKKQVEIRDDLLLRIARYLVYYSTTDQKVENYRREIRELLKKDDSDGQ